MISFVLISLLVVARTYAGDIDEEDGILVLKNSNFASVLEENEHVMVEFCKYSLLFQALMCHAVIFSSLNIAGMWVH